MKRSTCMTCVCARRRFTNEKKKKITHRHTRARTHTYTLFPRRTKRRSRFQRFTVSLVGKLAVTDGNWHDDDVPRSFSLCIFPRAPIALANTGAVFRTWKRNCGFAIGRSGDRVRMAGDEHEQQVDPGSLRCSSNR